MQQLLRMKVEVLLPLKQHLPLAKIVKIVGYLYDIFYLLNGEDQKLQGTQINIFKIHKEIEVAV